MPTRHSLGYQGHLKNLVS